MAAQSEQPENIYLRNKILNASPMQLIMILYEGAISSLHKYKQFIAKRRRENACIEIVRAQNMVRELRDSLDMSTPAISTGLYRIYDYMVRRLVSANLEASPDMADEVITMLTELKETWQNAMSKVTEEPAPQEIPDEALGGNTGYISIVS